MTNNMISAKKKKSGREGLGEGDTDQVYSQRTVGVSHMLNSYQANEGKLHGLGKT